MNTLSARTVWIGLVVLTVSGCAARREPGFASRFVKPGEPTADYGAGAATATPPFDLQEYSRKLRELQARATPRVPHLLPTLESRDPALAEALMRVALLPSAESHRVAAAAYRNAGVTDFAFRHYQRALRLQPCDSAAYEGLAQIWRDWGTPHLALGDAHRAIYCRPDSASAHNTLGTVLEALGQRENARDAFAFALRLHPGAAYALNNLCFLAIRDGDAAGARTLCERALAQDPAMITARTNLALAYAMQGKVEEAEAELLDSSDPAQAHYNIGMLRMSLADYAGAADAFERASDERPSLANARRRAIKARQLADAGRIQ